MIQCEERMFFVYIKNIAVNVKAVIQKPTARVFHVWLVRLRCYCRSKRKGDVEPPQKKLYYNTHTIHVWCIYLHEWLIFMANVGKYTIHGFYGIWLFVSLVAQPKLLPAWTHFKQGISGQQRWSLDSILTSSSLFPNRHSPRLVQTFLESRKFKTDDVNLCLQHPS